MTHLESHPTAREHKVGDALLIVKFARNHFFTIDKPGCRLGVYLQGAAAEVLAIDSASIFTSRDRAAAKPRPPAAFAQDDRTFYEHTTSGMC